MQYYASKFPPLKISPLCQEAFSLLYPRFLDRQWQNYINLRPGPLSPHNLVSAANHFFPQFFWFESTHITWVAESSTRMTPLAAAPAAAPCCGCRRGGTGGVAPGRASAGTQNNCWCCGQESVTPWSTTLYSTGTAQNVTARFYENE